MPYPPQALLHERCALPGYSPDEPVASPNELVEKYQFYRDGAPIFCNGQPDACPVGTSCVYFGANPNDDTVSFDSVRAPRAAAPPPAAAIARRGHLHQTRLRQTRPSPDVAMARRVHGQKRP